MRGRAPGQEERGHLPTPWSLWLALPQGEGYSSFTLWPTHPSIQALAPSVKIFEGPPHPGKETDPQVSRGLAPRPVLAQN